MFSLFLDDRVEGGEMAGRGLFGIEGVGCVLDVTLSCFAVSVELTLGGCWGGVYVS